MSELSDFKRRIYEPEIERYEHALAVARTERGHYRRAAKKWYERNRLLENRVRSALTDMETGVPVIPTMLAIVARVPRKSRPKWGSRNAPR
jgi:hypothetical protein